MLAFLKHRARAVTTLALLAMLIVLIWFILFLTLRDKIPDEEEQVLQNADKCTLLSVVWTLNAKLDLSKPAPPPPNYLAGCNIIGRVQLTGQSAKTAIAVFEGAPSLSLLGKASCFNARHALQIVANGHTYDYIICFECQQMEIYKDQVEVKNVNISGSPDTLNNILTENHIPLAPSEY